MRKHKCMAAGLLAISIASMSLLSGCELIDNVKNGVGSFFSSIFSKQTLGNEVYKEINGNKYYIKAGMILNINDMNEVKAVGVKADDKSHFMNSYCNYTNDIEPVYLADYRSVLVGNTIYTSYISDDDDFAEGIYKYTFTDDPCVLKKEVWIDKDKLDDSEISISTGYHNSIFDLKADGNYIYFINAPVIDYKNSYRNENNDTYLKMCRINLKTNEIELFDDVIATTYTIDNGWIYYFDDGNTNELSNDYGIDKDRSGIYKIKTDGTQKEKLYSLEETSSGYVDFRQLEIHNDKIYFIDPLNEEKLCCVNKDGSDYKVISENSVCSYAYNENEKSFYYFNFSYDDLIGNLYKINSDNTEEKMNGDFRGSYYYIDYCDSKIYFSGGGNLFYNVNYNTKSNDQSDYDIGIIYDVEEQETTEIKANYECKIYNEDVFERRLYEGPYFEVK